MNAATYCTTHHDACDCRQERVRQLEAKTERLEAANRDSYELVRQLDVRVAELEALVILIATESGRVIQEARHHRLMPWFVRKLAALEKSTSAETLRAALGASR